MRSALSRPWRLSWVRPASGEAGESMVEFALVLPLLLMVLIGIVQFGLVHHAQNVATTAAQEGARVGAAEDGDPTIAEARTPAPVKGAKKRTPRAKAAVKESASPDGPPPSTARSPKKPARPRRAKK